MPKLIGVREQLSGLGQIARAYPYPYNRQPPPLNGILDYFSDKLDGFSQSMLSGFNELCGKEITGYIGQLNRIASMNGKLLSDYAELTKAGKRIYIGNLDATSDLVSAAENRRSDALTLRDWIYSAQNEAYKVGVPMCETYFRGKTPAAGLSGKVTLGAVPAFVASIVLRNGAKFVVAAGILTAIAYYVSKALGDSEIAKAQAEALRNASTTAMKTCSEDPSSQGCRDAQARVAELARVAADQQKNTDKSGLGGTIQTVAKAGLLGLAGYIAYKYVTRDKPPVPA